jgi:hypothetical protein
MSKTRPGKENTEELREQVRQLQESLRKLQKGAKEPRGKAEGLAEGVVTALGKLVPGLGRLIETASQMPEFQQRLAAIDEEVKRKFKEQPLNRASLGIAGNLGRRQLGIPPSVRRGRPGRAASTGAGEAFCKKPSGKGVRRGKYRQPRPPKVHISPETPAQLHVDVFDEGSKIVVLAEAPGLKAENITVSLEGTVLLISVEAAHRGGLQRIELPCEVAGKPEMSLSNGILNIQIRKAGKQ